MVDLWIKECLLERSWNLRGVREEEKSNSIIISTSWLGKKKKKLQQSFLKRSIRWGRTERKPTLLAFQMSGWQAQKEMQDWEVLPQLKQCQCITKAKEMPRAGMKSASSSESQAHCWCAGPVNEIIAFRNLGLHSWAPGQKIIPSPPRLLLILLKLQLSWMPFGGWNGQ